MFNPKAVQVLNATSGGKLGTLPRDHAEILFPMLLSSKVTFQATIILIAENRRKMRLIVDVYAKSNRELTPDDIQQASNHVNPMLQKVDWKSGSQPTTDQILKETEAATEKALRELAREVAATGEAHAPSPEFVLEEEDWEAPADVDMSLMADWQSQQQGLDKMFEEIQNKQLADLPDVPMPKQFEKMDLYDYQKDGIRWLCNQERSDSKPSWFKQLDNGKWLCTVSGLSQLKDPHPIRGGILADGTCGGVCVCVVIAVSVLVLTQSSSCFGNMYAADMGLGRLFA